MVPLPLEQKNQLVRIFAASLSRTFPLNSGIATSNGEGTKVTTPLDSYPGLPEIGLDPPSKNSKEAKSTEMQDFFAAIEAEQPTMFNPQTNR